MSRRTLSIAFGAIVGLSCLGYGDAQSKSAKSFTGVITDSMCETGDHSRMKMGPTDGECAIACVQSHGALYVLYDGKDVYPLSDQTTPEKFAGKRVTVRGSLGGKNNTIQVESMAAAK